MVLLLVFMQLTRDLFAIAKFLLPVCYKLSQVIIIIIINYLFQINNYTGVRVQNE